MSDSEEEGPDVVRVGLGIRGKHLDPTSVTDALGVEPTTARVAGEEYRSKAGMVLKRPWGQWVFEVMREGKELNLEPVVADFLSRVEPVVARLVQFKNDPELRVSVYIHWEPFGGSGGYTLPAKHVASLMSLGNEADFYFS